MSAFDDYNVLCNAITNNERINNSVNNTVFRLKEHMENNPNDTVSIAIKTWFFNIIKREFLNSDLENAFNMSDNLPYYKTIEIYKNLPFIENYWNIKDFYYNLFINRKTKTLPKHLYITCSNICDKYFPNEIPKEVFERIQRFCNENKTIMANVPNITEKSKIKSNQNEIGIIGENYIHDLYNSYGGKVLHTNNNGFGFDLLYINPEYTKEYLIEVKSTIRKLEKDTYFHLSDNENNVLLNSFNLPNSQYLIERVYINKDNNCTNIAFHYDTETDSFFSDNDIRYTIYNKNKKVYKKTI